MSDIINDGMYSIDEMVNQNLTPLSLRYVQRYAKKVGIKKVDNGYKFFGFQITEMNNEYTTRHAKKEEKREARRKKEENTPPLTDGEYTGADEDTIEISVKDYDNIQRTIAREDIHLNKIEMLTQRVEEYQTDIKYFKDTLTEALSSMKESLKSIQQQNYISAKEKGFDKK
jgi:ABC-type Zn2+ transport system substrate-binding protein/surface adhesin